MRSTSRASTASLQFLLENAPACLNLRPCQPRGWIPILVARLSGRGKDSREEGCREEGRRGSGGGQIPAGGDGQGSWAVRRAPVGAAERRGWLAGLQLAAISPPGNTTLGLGERH